MPTKKTKVEDKTEEVTTEETPTVDMQQFHSLQKSISQKDKELDEMKSQLKNFYKGLKKLTGQEKEDPNADMKEYIKQTVLDAVKPINERLDAREQEEGLAGLTHNLGLNQQQAEYFEFQLAKLQNSRGEHYEITEKDIQNISNQVKKVIPSTEKKTKVEEQTDPQKTDKQKEDDAYDSVPVDGEPLESITISSEDQNQNPHQTTQLPVSPQQKMHTNPPKKQMSIVPPALGPANNLSDYSHMTVQKFQQMNPIELSEFYHANPKLYDRLDKASNDSMMDMGSKHRFGPNNPLV